MSKFWDKVSKCKHENISKTFNSFEVCWTEYCNLTETHCLDCGVYITNCQCGFCNGLSGWPESRHKTQRRNRKGKKQ